MIMMDTASRMRRFQRNLQDQWSRMGWYSEQQAYLLDRLASIPERRGHSARQYLSSSSTRSAAEIPMPHGHAFYAGWRRGRLATGRYISMSTRTTPACCQPSCLMGIEQNKFGHRDWAGPLPERLGQRPGRMCHRHLLVLGSDPPMVTPPESHAGCTLVHRYPRGEPRLRGFFFEISRVVYEVVHLFAHDICRLAAV